LIRLIITHNEFYIDNAAKQDIDSLAAHRANFNGFDVAIITTNTIYPAFPDTLFPKERIKKLIENTYND